MLRVGIAVGLIAACVAAVTAQVNLAGGIRAALVATLSLTIALGILAWRFFRDPERQPPARDDVVVSPADGEVLYVRKSR